MAILKNDKHLARFDYDFAKLGGAVGVIDLLPNITALEEGMVITDMYIYVEEAVTSAGSPTVTLGNLDADGFFVNVMAKLGVAGKVVRAGEVAGALLFDDTNDVKLAYAVGADKKMAMSIGSAALTGGKLQVYVEMFSPAVEA